MITYPNCKINFGLHVVGKREDGYHDLETIFLPAPLHDVLEIEPSDEFRFVQDGIAIEGRAEDNLVVKAYRLMQRETGIGGVTIRLTKKIPFGAGLGGGSSDAAFTLKMLDELFGLRLGSERLKGLASRLGADCAFFIDNVPSYATGIGDILTPLGFNPIEGMTLRIEKPEGENVSTAEAYRGLKVEGKEPATGAADRAGREQRELLTEAAKEKPERWRGLIVNDFEKSVFAGHPRIAELKERFYDEGAVFALMTGSGAAVFGVWEA